MIQMEMNYIYKMSYECFICIWIILGYAEAAFTLFIEKNNRYILFVRFVYNLINIAFVEKTSVVNYQSVENIIVDSLIYGLCALVVFIVIIKITEAVEYKQAEALCNSFFCKVFGKSADIFFIELCYAKPYDSVIINHIESSFLKKISHRNICSTLHENGGFCANRLSE